MAVILEIGDSVSLGDYRVELIVREISGDDITCEWFNRDNDLKSHSFKSKTLHRVQRRYDD